MTITDSEYFCQRCGLVVPGVQRQKNKFCPNCGSFLRPKIIRRGDQPQPLRRVARESERVELTKEDINVATLFQEFLSLKDFNPGEGVIFGNAGGWLFERELAYKQFRERFRSSLDSSQKVKEVFADFLYFRNNKSWTTLYRTGRAALSNPESLLRLLALLLDDSVDIVAKTNRALTGPEHVEGVGKNMVTAIIHVNDELDRYGVWNNRTEDTLHILRRLPPNISNPGEKYRRINLALNELKKELGTDLMALDSFIWYISKRVKVIG